MLEKLREKFTYTQTIVLSFALLTLIGAALLTLPISSNSGNMTPILNTIFTSTSAISGAGLVLYDTYTHWSLFGRIVILLLIQIGNLGFIIVLSMFSLFLRKRIGIYERRVLMQSEGTLRLSGVVKLLKRIFFITFFTEFLGATILAIKYIPEFGVGPGIELSIFHSVSAFCNAGFDVFGCAGGSITDFSSNYVVLITLMILIMSGGLGFIVWSDLIDTKFKWKKFQLHTKIVIVCNLVLVLVPALMFFLTEFTTFGQKGNFIHLPLGEKILNSFFLAVSPRTAGFNSIDLNELTSSGKLLTMILMFIGGNSGSTAGGVKVTTIVVVLANLIASAKNKEHVVIFKRRVSNSIIRQASSLFLAYAVMVIASTVIITAFETFTLEQVIFEVISAVGTVGLTLGVSAEAGVLTKLILAFLMYAGRLGALTLFGAIMQDKEKKTLIEPQGRLLVG